MEVVRKLPSIRAAFSELKRLVQREDFDCVVLIDYPDFNLRFAKVAKAAGKKVIYYISPQLWAWRKGRIRLIARVVDKMLVVLPFEIDIYREAGVDVEYVGHPLTNMTASAATKQEARLSLGVAENATTIALLPGSRSEEVARLLETMVKGAELFKEKLGRDITVLLPLANGLDSEVIEPITTGSRIRIQCHRAKTRQVLRAADAAVVSSGTATLEAALLGTPLLIVYKVSRLSYLLGRLLIGIDSIGLPNIIAGKKVVTELIQDDVTAENIASELSELVSNNDKREGILNAFKAIKNKLDGGDASRKAAEAILGYSNIAGV